MSLTRRETAILAIGDFVLLIASLWAALAVRNLALPSVGYFEINLVPFLPVFLLSIVVFYIAGLYEKQTKMVRREMGERIFKAQIANTVIAALLFFVLPLTIAPKTILAIYLGVSVIAVSAWRFYRAKRDRQGAGRTSAVLVAQGDAARELFEEVNGNDRYLFSFSAHIDPVEKTATALAQEALEEINKGAKVVILDTRDPTVIPALPRLYGALIGGASFVEFAGFYEDVFDRVPLANIDHAWLLEALPHQHVLYDIAKQAFDFLCGAIALTLTSPLLIVSALALLLMGQPAFFFSERIGKDGKPFKLIKLQTMLLNDQGDPELRKQNKVTPFGRFLRKTRIDELPQLVNVLRGDLSFVGPRPELPKLAETYDREIPYYHVRHLITPGLSGWAQINHVDAPKGEADTDRTRVKLSYDLYYVKRRSLGLDVAIMLRTIRTILSFSGK